MSIFINNLLNKKSIFALGLAGAMFFSPVVGQENESLQQDEEIVVEEGQKYTNDGAVILLFHRFGNEKYPSTNITKQQLDDLIAYIKDNEFNVIKLSDAISAIQSGDNLPDKSIVLTIDDAFKSVYTVAYPKFSENNFPFTVFVSSRGVNANNPAYMNWDEIKEMSQNGVDIQAHTINHSHMTTKSLNINSYEVETNITEIETHTGIRPTLFAYPYGEANNEVIDMIKEKGLVAGFSQHSGVYNSTSNQFYIPRFSINERWGTLDRLKLILNTKPFKTKFIDPSEPYITDNNPPMISVQVDESITDLSNLNCFRSDTGKVSLEKAGDTFDMVFTTPFKQGRTRINCTLPHGDGSFKWLGFQFTKD